RALDELHAQILLELFQLRGQGRLADETTRRGPAEVPLIRHRHQITQVLELEVHVHLYTKSIRIIKSIDLNASRSRGNMAGIPRGSRSLRHVRRRSAFPPGSSSRASSPMTPPTRSSPSPTR